MKPVNLTIALALLLTGNILAAKDPFQDELHFNRPVSPRPYTGLDLLRQENPFILVQRITNATSTTLFNRDKYLTLPFGSNTGLYQRIAQYSYDSLQQKWIISYLHDYDLNYEAGSMTVTGAETRKTYSDSTLNQQFSTSFAFNSFNTPDTQWVYKITPSGKSLQSRILFTYGSPLHLTSISEEHPDGSNLHTLYKYDSASRLLSELALRTLKSGTPDSISRQTYAYDSTGKLELWQEERYNTEGHPGAWTIVQKITYTYDNKSRLAGDRSYTTDSTLQLVLDVVHLYSYTEFNKIETFIEMKAHNGDFFPRNKLMIFYDANQHASYGYSYPWEDTDYSHRASAYYTFRQEEPTGLRHSSLHKNIKVYPNPASGVLNLGSELGEAPFSILDNEGRMVMESSQGQHPVIDISGLKPGIYMLVTAEYGTLRFIKA